MKLGITLHAYRCPVKEALAYMKKYGFETTFYSSLASNLDEVMTACREAGIEMENYHAPFRHINDIWQDTPEGEQMLQELLDSVDNCAKYGVPTLVVHLSSGDRPPRINTLGMARFERLMEHAKEKGVTIAYENQRKLANLALTFEEFEDAAFCWDTGHEACFADGRQYMPLFGKYLAALHIHDNHCVHNGDEHLVPYDGTIDFDRVARQIAETDYQGSLMLEVMADHAGYYEGMSADDYFAHAAKAVKKLAAAIEEIRKTRV